MREVESSHRLKVSVRGAVQGVGFRPFVYRLATEAGLKGWVNNSAQGVFLEVEGPQTKLESFLLRLESEKPPRSSIQSLEASWLDPLGYTAFEIRPSDTGGAKTALVLPDIATCPDCLAEIFDPRNRRRGYPFTNCTNCGPRFSIIESLPYDRANTSMKGFNMCAECRAEYDNPLDRRFHAQPNACPVCGPQLELWNCRGKPMLAEGDASERGRRALAAAADAIRRGQIVAVKGLGGFHLMVAAHDDDAVHRLRQRKHREEKPFALMFPSLASAEDLCEVSALEERLLRSPESPIVLLRTRTTDQRLLTADHELLTTDHTSHTTRRVSPLIAPNNPTLGVMLPYTPLHHLLLAELRFPVVATSGNLSDEPICTDEREAVERLGAIADLFLVHNRPIVRHVDDSIVRVMMDRELVLRRARGYAPLPVQLYPFLGNRPLGNGDSVLAVGAHLKNTVALSVGPQVFISQHIGDLETEQSFSAFRRVIADFQMLYEARPTVIAADAHPDYLSTRYAGDLVSGKGASQEASTQPSTLNPQLLTIQHHISHVLACMADNELEPPVLGVSWDGTGFGLDGTIWGGEFFLVTDSACSRVATLRPFRLPGGDAAVKEPRRTALGLLYELFGDGTFDRKGLPSLQAFSTAELGPLKTMLARGLNSPVTSSIGRLFDAVASLVGVRQQVRFEGQAAMELEFALRGSPPPGDAYTLPLLPVRTSAPAQGEARLLDWSPMINSLLADLQAETPLAVISAKFHNALAEVIIAVAQHTGQSRVVLSGGCFQNRYLTERAVQRLQAEGFHPYWHQRVPPNDGGIALGQVVAALRAQPAQGGWRMQDGR